MWRKRCRWRSWRGRASLPLLFYCIKVTGLVYIDPREKPARKRDTKWLSRQVPLSFFSLSGLSHSLVNLYRHTLLSSPLMPQAVSINLSYTILLKRWEFFLLFFFNYMHRFRKTFLILLAFLRVYRKVGCMLAI